MDPNFVQNATMVGVWVNVLLLAVIVLARRPF